jgi:hypothetical protein
VVRLKRTIVYNFERTERRRRRGDNKIENRAGCMGRKGRGREERVADG